MRPNGWNKTHLTYTFANGSFIEFFSADQEDKLRGARRHVLYVNEANNIPFAAYHQLAIRTSQDIYIDFNPTATFWAHTEVLEEPDSEHLILTYKHNEALPDTIKADIEQAKEKAKTSDFWSNWWTVYGLGQTGKLQGVILNDWQKIDRLPTEAKLIGYGIDFGYTADPTTVIGAYEYNGQRVYDELVYNTGLGNRELSKLMNAAGLKPTDRGVADSSAPKDIADLHKNFKWNIKGVKKGPGSINFGIGVMQENPFLVTKRSTNIIEELRHYCWDTDKEGKELNTPIDAYNHCIDAMRYIETTFRLKPKGRMRTKTYGRRQRA